MNEQLFHCKQGGTAVGRPCSNGAVFLFTKRRRMKMKKLSSSEIRQMYLDFFQEKGHKVQPSASLIPVNDPTLLWINSGVATLKKYFDGTETPEVPRITNAQKSIRTNDIENVGHTARHHTLFEMMGNFSIGDYFKEEVIPWAWEFLTSEKWLGLDPDRLYVTYYPKDPETKTLWMDKVGLPEDHIIPVEDNFWDIGAGPCGPDTEIFYDRGEKYNNLAEDDPENYPGGENERYLEIWNLVFSQFNHMPDGTYPPLPHKNVDTGMGLERVVSVIQDTPTNFETDLFMPIIQQLEQLSAGKKYNTSKDLDVSFKVIADHIRAVSFAIGDGALPSNEGRGYIIRRLIRRSVMHGQRLGIQGSFLTKLVPTVASIMHSYYPEVTENMEFIQKVIANEENRFQETIHDGLAILETVFAEMKEQNQTVLSGENAFKLYDTYGFPYELTLEYASDNGYEVDEEGFQAEMKAQKERARAARNTETSMNVQSAVLRDITVESTFVGYDRITDNGVLKAIVFEDELVESALEDTRVQVVFDQTPFYAEMGGQLSDHGVIKDESGQVVATVVQVKKAPNGQPLHTIDVVAPMQLNSTYVLEVDQQERAKLIKNHTATHLLHQALKEVLGTHANQAGSLVAPGYLRFDFSHFGQVTAEELAEMERIVNEKIWAALDVVTIETTLEEAKKLGAMALFGEKYGNKVRMVNIANWSIELCGGVHVSNTQEIGLFKIISESGIGAGVRRIEAVTSQEAFELLAKHELLLKQIASDVKAVQLDSTPERVSHLQQELKEAQHEISALKAKLMKSEVADLFESVSTAGNYSFITVHLPNKDMNELRQLADTWRQKAASDVFVVATNEGEKANLLAAVSKDANEKGVKAGDIIKAIASHIQGGGGGRPDMAQAGGKNPAGIPAALKAVEEFLTQA